MSLVVVTGGAVILEKIDDTLDTFLFPISKQEEIDFAELIGSRGLKYLTEATKLSLAASIMAKKHAGLGDIPAERGGVTLATNLASISHVTEFDLTALQEGVNNVSPMQGPNLLLNAPASRLGIHHKLSGYNTTITSGRVGGLDALEFAYHSIVKGEVDVCIVGGVEEKSQYYLDWFKQAGLVTDANQEQINQGAGVLILESRGHAEARGAQIYGEICDFSALFDVYSLGSEAPHQMEENYESLIENLVVDQAYMIQSVSLSDNQLHGTVESEKLFFKSRYQDARLVQHYEKFGGELNSCSGIVQLMAALDKGKSGYGLVCNYDWFGNYRSLLFNKG